MELLKENKNKLSILIVVVLLFFMWALSLTTPPTNFGSGKIITIHEGESVKGAAEILKNADIIRSSSVFTTSILFSDGKVIAGDYFFHKPINVFKVINRISNGSYNIPTQQVFFYEGMTVEQMAIRLKDLLPNFDVITFLELAEKSEGYLFPDTYTFPQNISAENVIKAMRDNFNKQIEKHSEIIGSSKYSLDEIVIMASIVEREATSDSKQDVADILWNRIEIDMALQVDAPFVYVIGKGSADLTKEDLQEDNPYNTYVNKGLTPTAISNPGIEAILAAANPRETNRLFFLTGSDGKMYYAEDFEEHKRNKSLYLN